MTRLTSSLGRHPQLTFDFRDNCLKTSGSEGFNLVYATRVVVYCIITIYIENTREINKHSFSTVSQISVNHPQNIPLTI